MVNVEGRAARIQYLPGSFRLLSPGDYVLCAITAHPSTSCATNADTQGGLCDAGDRHPPVCRTGGARPLTGAGALHRTARLLALGMLTTLAACTPRRCYRHSQ